VIHHLRRSLILLPIFLKADESEKKEEIAKNENVHTIGTGYSFLLLSLKHEIPLADTACPASQKLKRIFEIKNFEN
jgi:hypothetical protein